MEKILVHITELHNQTNQVFGFEVEKKYLRMRDMPPNKKRYVELWKVLKVCHKHNSPEWKIRLMMNGEFSGVEINANLLLSYARIIIKLERIGDGLYLPYLETILEKPYIDHWLRLKFFGCMRNRFWDKRPFSRIWLDTGWAKNLRVAEAQSAPQLLAPVANQSLLQSCRSVEKLPTEGENREIKINAGPPLEGPDPAAERKKEVEALHLNDDIRTVSSLRPAALHPEEQGPPVRERIRGRPDKYVSVANIERRLGGNRLEQPHQREDDSLNITIKSEDMEKTLHHASGNYFHFYQDQSHKTQAMILYINPGHDLVYSIASV